MSAKVDSSPRSVAHNQLREVVRSSLRAGGLTSFSGTTSYIAILVTSITFASTSTEAAGLRSLLVPLTLFLGGVSMLFSIPAQISAARGSRHPGGATVRSWLLWMAVIAATFAFIALSVAGALHTVARPLVAGFLDDAAALQFLALMPIAYILLACSDFIEGFLRGSGRFIHASALVITRSAVICCSYVLWVGLLRGDPLALPWFYMAGCTVTLLAGAAIVGMVTRGLPVFVPVPDKANMRSLVLRVGLPVLASYILLSSVVGIQIGLVSAGLGRNAEIAFSGMQMVQTLCVVAAMGLAVGVSSEVLRRTTTEGLTERAISSVIARVSTLIFIVEALVFVVFVLAARPLLDLLLVGASMTGDVLIGSVLLVLTALFIANDVFVLTVLEEIGAALLGLALNGLYFAALIVLTWAAAIHGSFSTLAYGLLFLSVGGAVGLRFVLRVRARKPENKPVEDIYV